MPPPIDGRARKIKQNNLNFNIPAHPRLWNGPWTSRSLARSNTRRSPRTCVVRFVLFLRLRSSFLFLVLFGPFNFIVGGYVILFLLSDDERLVAVAGRLHELLKPI